MPDNPNVPRIITPEAEKIARTVRTWLNDYPDLPTEIVDVEFLGEESGLAIMTTQAAYKTRQFILGDYEAQYQFQIWCRNIPTTANERLLVDELLNNIAMWATQNPPVLESPCRTMRVVQNTNAALIGRFENGAEDHSINMTLIYEVTKYGYS